MPSILFRPSLFFIAKVISARDSPALCAVIAAPIILSVPDFVRILAIP